MSLKAVTTEALRFDPSGIRKFSATRCAIGIAIPIAICLALKQPTWGVATGIGGLYAGLASMRGTYRFRVHRMLETSIALAVITLLVGLASPYPILAVTAVSILCFPLALYSMSGASQNTLAVVSAATAVIFAFIPQTPHQALGNALLLAGGAVAQTLILNLAWPLSPNFPERRAVVRVYRGLAQFVSQLQQRPRAEIPNAGPFIEAREVPPKGYESIMAP